MPNITIQGMSTSGCNHRVVQTDVGNYGIHLSEVLDAKPGTFEEMKEAFIIVAKHQYLTRRAAGRTQAQALADLVGFTVRI